MMLDANQHDGPSNSEIVQQCLDPDRQLVGGSLYGNFLVKISDEVVVKFGRGVSLEEAINQKKAFELLDSNIVRVP